MNKSFRNRKINSIKSKDRMKMVVHEDQTKQEEDP